MLVGNFSARIVCAADYCRRNKRGVFLEHYQFRQLWRVHISGIRRPVRFLFPCLLPLDLVHEVKVGLVECMHSHIAILTTTGICIALGMDCNGVQGTEVPSYSPYFILEDLVIEPSLEFSLSSRCCGHIHGCLTTTENNEVFLWCDCCRVERGISNVCF
jgi:hypothetical protein